MNDNQSALFNSLDLAKPVRILFVCLGNSCRSPAAEEITRGIAKEMNLGNRVYLDSAGTYGGHRGQLPDSRMRAHAIRRDYNLTHHSRPIKESDFDDFDIIVAMDDSNFNNLKHLAPTPEDESKIVRMADFMISHPYHDHIPDPYYEGAEGFELVLDLLEDSCRGLLNIIFKS